MVIQNVLDQNLQHDQVVHFLLFSVIKKQSLVTLVPSVIEQLKKKDKNINFRHLKNEFIFFQLIKHNL